MMNITACKAKALLAFIVLFTIPAQAAAERQWRSVFIDGVKAGHGFRERLVTDDTITIHESLTIKIKRPRPPSMQLTVELTTEERADGTPLKFSKHIRSINFDS